MHGCFYHISSSMWKRIQQSRLQEGYINDPEFALHLRMISALAFVPPNDVQNSFDQLAALICNQMEMVQMEFRTSSRIIMLGGSASMFHKAYTNVSNEFLECFTTQMMSFHEQIMLLRGGTEGSKHIFLPVLLCFGSLLKCYKRRKLLSEWEFYKMKVATILLHKEEDALIATSLSSELLMTFQIVKELIMY